VEFPSRRLESELDEVTCGGAFIAGCGTIGLTRIFGIGRLTAEAGTGCEEDSDGCDDANEVGAVGGAVGTRLNAVVGPSLVAIFELPPAGRLLGEPLPTVESNSGLVDLSMPYTEMFANFCWYSCTAAGPQCAEFA